MKNMKRIHRIVVKQMYDESPDTSWLGEYGSRAESEWSIDREHATDCQAQTFNNPVPVLNQLERAISYLNEQTYSSEHSRRCAHSFLSSAECTCGLFEQNDAIQDAQNLLIEAQDELQECNCGGEGLERNSYQFFNPNHENYAGLMDTEIREYCLQDYARMESLNNQEFCFIGIRAEADYSTGGQVSPVQTVTSGGLGGIESDSGKDFIKETEEEELHQLKAELKAIGFSSRAIATAFKNVERKEL